MAVALIDRSHARRPTAGDWLVVAAAALVAAASLAPWFRTRFASDDGWDGNTASAWQSSTWWSFAVVLCLAAAVVSFVSRRPYVRGGCVAACVGAAGLIVWQWLTIGSLDPGGGLGWTASEPSSAGVGEIVRDELVIVHRDGLHQDVAWGLYAGMAAVLLLTVVVVAATRASARAVALPKARREPDLRQGR